MKISNRFFTSTTRKVEQVQGRYYTRGTYPSGVEVSLMAGTGWDLPAVKLELNVSEAQDLALELLTIVAQQRREAERKAAKESAA